MTELTRPDGAVIHYEVSGSGPPLLALAPGTVDSGISTWPKVGLDPVAEFAGQYTVIVVDQRHAGASLAPLTPFSWEQALGDQLAVLDREGVASALILGAGIGCSYALRLAYEAPARVQAAALLEPLGLADDSSLDHFYGLFRETIRVARAEGLSGVVDAAIANADFSANPASGPWAARLHADPGFREALLSLGRETYIALIVDFRDGIWPWQQTSFAVNNLALTRIATPLLVLPGSGDDPLAPAAVADALCNAVPQARQVAAGDAAARLDALNGFFVDNGF